MADGRPGHLCFGPYFPLGEGSYVAGYYLRRLPGSAFGMVDFDVLAGGAQTLAHKTLPAASLFEDTLSFVALEFSVASRADRAEVRLHVGENVLVEASELVVFSCRARNWGGQ